MLLHRAFVIPLAAALALPAGAALSQESAPSAAPSSLVFYFDAGSAKVRPKDVALFDQASRLYGTASRSSWWSPVRPMRWERPRAICGCRSSVPALCCAG